MAYPDNILQQVQTYQESALAYLENQCCFVSTANTKFKDFQNKTANLGDSVSFDLPPRYISNTGLVATFQASQQRQQTLTCDQAGNTSYAFTAQDFLFNVEDYMDKFGMSAMTELATEVESNLALNAISGVPVYNIVNGQSIPTGAFYTNSGPYRFFGNGTDQINSYQQLAQMIVNFKNYGAVSKGIKVYLPDTVIPPIIGSGLNQFAPTRNNEIANSWEIGTFGSPPVTYYTSNLLPIHIAGNVGENNLPLTVVSTNDPTGQNITQITFSGASNSDANAIKAGDLFQFNDNIGSFQNLRFLTFIGHKPSAQPVQFRATADAASNGSGQVTVNIFPALVSAPGANQNLNTALQTGMQASVLPSHRAGLVVGGNALFLAMPALPDTTPFPSSSKYDSDTGVSIRNYYGTLFGQNQQGYINDCIWGSTLVPEYSMRIAFPI